MLCAFVVTAVYDFTQDFLCVAQIPRRQLLACFKRMSLGVWQAKAAIITTRTHSVMDTKLRSFIEATGAVPALITTTCYWILRDECFCQSQSEHASLYNEFNQSVIWWDVFSCCIHLPNLLHRGWGVGVSMAKKGKVQVLTVYLQCTQPFLFERYIANIGRRKSWLWRWREKDF